MTRDNALEGFRKETLVYSGQHLLLDLWRPNCAPKGLIVHAHGGGFVHGSRDDRIARHFGPKLATEGTAFASISYRKGGAASRAFALETLEAINAEAQESCAFYPSVRPNLFGASLYRAAVDFRRAVGFLRGYADGMLAGLPWLAMGNSSGALAAITAVYPPAALPLEEAFPAPQKVIAIASIVPQPWLLRPDGPQVCLLTARGDQVFPRAEVTKLEGVVMSQSLPVEIKRMPYGQHTRPVREVVSDPATNPFAQWFLAHVETGNS
jgi:hypothetical protein